MIDDPRANALVDARRDRRQLKAPLPPIQDERDAYVIQDAVARQLGPVGAWKVGAKSATAQPTCAPILAATLRGSPAVLSALDYQMIGIEAELAFRLSRSFAAGRNDVTRQEVVQAITAVHAVIEVVDTRIADWRNADRLWLLADNQMNAGLVYGPPAGPRHPVPFDQVPVRLAIDGRDRVDHVGGNPGGDPLRLLHWLVDHVCRERGGLPAGALVTTGSCTGMIFVERGATIEAEFAGIGKVSVIVAP